MDERKFSKVADERRQIAEWRDGRGMFVIVGIVAVFAIAFILNAFHL